MWIKKNEKIRSHSNRVLNIVNLGVKVGASPVTNETYSNNTVNEQADTASFLKCNDSSATKRQLRFQTVMQDVECVVALFYVDYTNDKEEVQYYTPIGFIFKKSDVEKYLIKHTFDFDDDSFPQKYSIVPIPYTGIDYKNYEASAIPDKQFSTKFITYPVNPSMGVVAEKGSAVSDLSSFLYPESGGDVSYNNPSGYDWFASTGNVPEDLFILPINLVVSDTAYGGLQYEETTDIPILMDFAYLFFDVSMRDGIINSADVIKINEI